MNEHFNKFEQITHFPLRMFNCVVLMFNLSEDFGPHAVQEYISLFTQEERMYMNEIINDIRERGADVVRLSVTEGVVFEDVSDVL